MVFVFYCFIPCSVFFRSFSAKRIDVLAARRRAFAFFSMKLRNLSHHSLAISRALKNVLEWVNSAAALKAQNDPPLFIDLDGFMLAVLLPVVLPVGYGDVQQRIFISLWLHQSDDVVAFISHLAPPAVRARAERQHQR